MLIFFILFSDPINIELNISYAAPVEQDLGDAPLYCDECADASVLEIGTCPHFDVSEIGEPNRSSTPLPFGSCGLSEVVSLINSESLPLYGIYEPTDSGSHSLYPSFWKDQSFEGMSVGSDDVFIDDEPLTTEPPNIYNDQPTLDRSWELPSPIFGSPSRKDESTNDGSNTSQRTFLSMDGMPEYMNGYTPEGPFRKIGHLLHNDIFGIGKFDVEYNIFFDKNSEIVMTHRFPCGQKNYNLNRFMPYNLNLNKIL